MSRDYCAIRRIYRSLDICICFIIILILHLLQIVQKQNRFSGEISGEVHEIFFCVFSLIIKIFSQFGDQISLLKFTIFYGSKMKKFCNFLEYFHGSRISFSVYNLIHGRTVKVTIFQKRVNFDFLFINIGTKQIGKFRHKLNTPQYISFRVTAQYYM